MNRKLDDLDTIIKFFLIYLKKKEKDPPSFENIKYYHTVKYISGFEKLPQIDCVKVHYKIAQASIKHWYTQRKELS
jgi:hypothetical protein